MFVASVQLTLDYDTLIEADSHNDDQQEDKNDYREDDGTTFYRDRPRSRKAASCGTFQISRDIRLSPQSGPKRTSVTI
jgi:hypothetical protein